MSVLVRKQTAVVDNFEGWNDGVEGADRPEGAGLIQGTLVKFTNTAQWVTRDDDEISPDLELICVDLQRVVQKWEDGQPVETKILGPGENFPDIEAMNEAVPRDEWVEGPDGQLRGPWQAQHLVYLLDPSTMEKFTFATGTVGGRIAVRELVDKTVWMRRTRGPNVFPVVTLGDTFMKTRFGGRQRPHFKITKWTRLGGEGEGDVQALPPPTPAPLVPSLSEEMNDDLPDDLAAPKKPAKASKAAPKNGKRANMMEAG
jgi:hypothetical protein